jgi:hypothetical protein
MAGERPDGVMTLRVMAKRHIAREAAAGTRSLVQAAALFRILNRHPPALLVRVRLSGPAHSEEEELCWQVIRRYVTSQESDWPEVAAAVARLEAELQEELRRHGAVQLPDPAGLPSAEQLLEEAQATMTEAERRACLPAPHGQPPRR